MACAAPLLERPPHVMRRAGDGDVGLIYSAWLQGQREVEPWARESKPEYYAREKARIGRRLAAGAEVLVACHAGDASEVIGWVCFTGSGPLVHWVYVQKPWRQMGFGALLLAAAGVRADGSAAVRTTGWSKHSGWIARRVRLEFVGGA